ncbi:hypothetical protein N7517_004985 [Penicillium concentricum]|uniref:Uncharacterized protein n=1 Tax=Penicillium concentricum TaxID=293559 RepID=A0A9W9S991_9EURO|nr:uncharacterized protein N7517_004985 [Penicillium concentricum]KAJ5372979.1 hypothetical protein N7517_004985 [Penicillium concentricum]
MIMVARERIPLVGRKYATKLGNLTLKTNSNVENSLIFSLKTVIASNALVKMDWTIRRQYKTLRGDREYKMELAFDTAVDVVANDQDMVILLGDTNGETPSRLVWMVDAEGYHIECAEKTAKDHEKVRAIAYIELIPN